MSEGGPKACPFCGAAIDIVRINCGHGGPVCYAIEHTETDCILADFMSPATTDLEKLIREWNRRADP